MADGTLTIETAIDKDGFVADGKDVEAAAKRMSKTVSKIGENFDLGSVLGDVIIVCKNLQKSMDNLASAMAKGFKKAGSAAKEAAGETEKLTEKEKYAAKLAEDMKNLKITRMDDVDYADEGETRTAQIHDYGQNEEAIKAVDEFAQSLDGAEKSSNRLKKQIEELEGKLSKLEDKGLYFGDDEYDEAYISLKKLDLELKEYIAGLNEASKKEPEIDTSEMEEKLDGLKQRLKYLRNQGFVSGDKDYDQTVVAINEVTKAIKEYRRELLNAAQGIRLPGLDTMEGQINALKAKLVELKNQGLSFGNEEFDQTALALKRATQAMSEYQQNLFKTEAQIQKEEAAQRKLNEEIERTRQKEAAAAAEAEELRRIGDSARVSSPHVIKLRQELEELLERQKKLEKAGLGFGYEEYDSNAKKIKKLKDSLAKYTGETKKAHRATELFGSAWKKLGTVSKKLGNQVWKLASNLNATKKSSDHARMSLGKMLGMSVLFSTVFRAISGVTNGIKEGMQNLAQYSDRTNASLSLLMSSLTRLKNSFATAFAPILSVVAPIMSSFIDMISRGTTYVGMFFASLTGQDTFTRAKSVQQDYAASLDKTSQSTKKAAKATKDAAKDAKGSLAPWDELNIIQTNLADSLDNTADVETPELTPQDMFKEVPIKSSVKNFADRIKKMIKAQDWNGIGKLLGQQINKGLKKLNKAISWDTVGDDITKGVDAITGIFNALVDEIDWEYMGNTAGEGINTLFKTLNQIMEKTDWKNLGKGFAEFANGLMDTVEWDEVGAFLGNKFMVLWNLLNGFVHELHWEDIGVSIGETLNAAFAKISFSDIADTLATGINGAFEALAGFTATFDWQSFADNVKNGINTFLKKTDWEDNGEALNDFLTEFLGALLDAAEGTDWEAFGKGVGDFLSKIDWETHLLTLLGILEEVLGGIWKGLGDTSVGKFIEAIVVFKLGTKLMPFVNNIVKFFTGQSVGQKLTSAFKKLLGKSLTDAATGEAGGGILATLGGVLKKGVSKLGGALKGALPLLGKGLLWGGSAVGAAFGGFKLGEWISTEFLGGEKKSVKDFVQDNIIGYQSGDITGAFNEFWKEVTGGFQPLSSEDIQIFDDLENTIYKLISMDELEGLDGFELIKYLTELKNNGESSSTAMQALKDKLSELGISSEAFETALQIIQGSVEAVGTEADNTKDKASEMIQRINAADFTDIEDKISGFNTVLQTVDFARLVTEASNAIDEMGGIWENGKQVLGEKALQIYQEISSGLEPDADGYYHLANGQMVQYGKGIQDYEDNAKNTLDATLRSAIENALPDGYELYYKKGENEIAGYTEGLESKKTEIEGAADKVLQGASKKSKSTATKEGKETGENLGKGLISGIESTQKDVNKSLMDLVDDDIKAPMKSGLQLGSPSKLFGQYAVWCGEGFANSLPGAFANSFGFFRGLGTNISNSIGDLSVIGHNAIIGLNNGMVRASNTLFDNARKIAGSISNIFKNVLKIHSPSKVMEELGGYTMEGFQSGMEGWMDKITGLAERLSESIQSAMQISVPDINVPITLDPKTSSLYPRQIPVMAQGVVLPPKAVNYGGGSSASVDTSGIKRAISEAIRESKGTNNDGLIAAFQSAMSGMAVVADNEIIGYLQKKNREYKNTTSGVGLFDE